jgi:hypothetical protein
MKKDFLVLTCTLGNKDILKDPPKAFDSCDYIAIVDKDYDVKVWQQYGHYNFSSIDQYTHRRNAKLYKVLSTILFPDYEYIIWHDANHQLMTNPSDIIDEYGNFDMCLINHPLRDCAYDEMEVVAACNLDDLHNLYSQKIYYESKGFPKHNGLYAMGCHVKKNTPKMTTFELKWWEHICKFSSRDQCSFSYCLWEMGSMLDVKTFNCPKENTMKLNKYFNDINTRLK